MKPAKRSFKPVAFSVSRNTNDALWGALIAVLGLSLIFWSREKLPVMLGFDFREERCLPDVKAALLVKGQHTNYSHGELVYFPPPPALAYVKAPYVMKRIAGVSGDRLRIFADGRIEINGSIVANGLPLSKLYNKRIQDLTRNEIIPKNMLFLIGTHPLSDDSRYWGYMQADKILGLGYRLF